MSIFYFVRPRERYHLGKYRPVCKFFQKPDAERYVRFITEKYPGYGRMDIIAAYERPEEWEGPQPSRI